MRQSLQSAEISGKLKAVNKKHYRRSELKNGIVLLTECTRYFKSLSIGVWVRGGSRHETPTQAGMAHFLEHMMFKGTGKRSAIDIARDVDLVGGDFNAMTTREYTCFHITLPVKEIDFALDLLSDIIIDSKFDPIELERERMVIEQEIAMVDESPEEFVHDVMFEKAYCSHPLGRDILGNLKTLRSFDRTHVLEYFQRHYYSRNIVISVAGAVDHDSCVRKLNKLLGDFKGKRSALPRASTKKPIFHPGVHVVKQKSEQSHIVVACESYPIMHDDRLPLFLLNSFLGGSMSSALFQSIREERGLAYTVYSSLAPFTDCGIFGMYVATNPKTVGDCLKLMREEIERLQRHPISDKDLMIAKNTIKSAVLMGGDSMENRMFALAKGELFYEGPISDDDICAQVDRVSPDDLMRVARELFSPNKWLVVGLGDVKTAELKKHFKI